MSGEEPLERLGCIAIVGAGRMGNALAHALRTAGAQVLGPLGRGDSPGQAEVVLLCVPDAQITTVAGQLAPGPVVGHCSGATSLDALKPHAGFSLHPLMTIPGGRPARFAGVTCAVAAASPQGDRVARMLAGALGMNWVEVAEEDRVAYHAAASIASNFLVTLEAAAETLAAEAGLARSDLAPLVRATVENWSELGPREALTGPIARGDDATVAAQRAAVAARSPELLALWDCLAAATHRLARAS